MSYRLRLSRDVDANRALFARGLPGDEWVGDHHAFWVASAPSGEVVGFCSAGMVPRESSVFLSSAAVFPGHRGRGLQRMMIQRRLTWAARRGAVCAVTYTMPHNWRSVSSLLKCGFVRYVPARNWAGKGLWYWMRDLSRPDQR